MFWDLALLQVHLSALTLVQQTPQCFTDRLVAAKHFALASLLLCVCMFVYRVLRTSFPRGFVHAYFALKCAGLPGCFVDR